MKLLKSEDDVKTTDKDEECTVYQMWDKNGSVLLEDYSVFSGIHVIYNDIKMTKCNAFIRDSSEKYRNVLEINHCREGRLECSSGDEFFYLSPGDISIHNKSTEGNDFYFPSGNYNGVTVIVDVEKAPNCLSCFLDDVNVQPRALMEKFCADNKSFVARSDVHLEHIFSEIYNIPEEVKKGYLKIKVLEIFLFLSSLKVESQEKRKTYSASQVALAKEICQYLTSRMDERITIDDLSEIFHVSQTQLKNCFKGVYGISIYSFIRTQKMQNAAIMLKDTHKTVLEIANLHGYDNGSKFAAAFRDTIGMTPNEYRQHFSIE